MTRSNVEHLQNEVFLLKFERDEARAEVERWTQKLLHHDASVERERDDALAEVEHLRRGIEAYRATTPCHIEQCGWPECPSCLWEREDAERRESGDER